MKTSKYIKYIEKSDTLLAEAVQDLKCGCYNKAISASWFAIETLLRGLILSLNRPMVERSGRLIGQIQRILHDNFPELISIIPKVHSIYEKRKRADHREIKYNKIEAQKTIKVTRIIITKLKKILKGPT